MGSEMCIRDRLGQGAALVELGKADGHPAADGGPAIELGLGAQKETFAAARNPGHNLGTVLQHTHMIALGQAQDMGRQTVEQLAAVRGLSH